MKMAAHSHTASELPLEELLALYGYSVSDPEKDSCHVAASLPDMTRHKDQITDDPFPGEEKQASADYLAPPVTSNTSDLLHHLQGGDKDTSVNSSDEESDGVSSACNEERKEIMVGSMYQAKIPPLSAFSYHEGGKELTLDTGVGSGQDQLLWRPGVLPVQEVEEFLVNAQRPRSQEGAACTRIRDSTVQDNEQALYELVKCNFSADEALRRLRFNVKVFSDELCAWSEEECRSFEHGYRVYGKNFHLIQANKVRTRSVGECVEYYYMWKKSDRHEYFTQQATRITRKKYSLQTGGLEDGDPDGEAGELEESSPSSGLLSGSSVGHRHLESPFPPQSNLDLERQDGALVMGMSELCGEACPQQLIGCCPLSLPPAGDLQDPRSAPVPPQSQSQPRAQSSRWACRGRPSLPGSCFYRLHMLGGPFAPGGPDFAAAGGSGAPRGSQVEFSLPSTSPPSSAALSSHFQAFIPSSIPALSHSDGT